MKQLTDIVRESIFDIDDETITSKRGVQFDLHWQLKADKQLVNDKLNINENDINKMLTALSNYDDMFYDCKYYCWTSMISSYKITFGITIYRNETMAETFREMCFIEYSTNGPCANKWHMYKAENKQGFDQKTVNQYNKNVFDKFK